MTFFKCFVLSDRNSKISSLQRRKQSDPIKETETVEDTCDCIATEIRIKHIQVCHIHQGKNEQDDSLYTCMHNYSVAVLKLYGDSLYLCAFMITEVPMSARWLSAFEEWWFWLF